MGFRALISVLILLGPAFPGATASSGSLGSGVVASGFTFSAAGDHGNTTDTVASLERLADSGSAFYLALGDLSYEPPGTESAWCDLVKSKVGGSFPFELLSGNHEDDAQIDGWIGNFVDCLPDRLNVTGTYGAEYYFDYPSDRPLARFILIAPGLTLFNVPYRYAKGDDQYNSLASRIDEARSAGIPWVVVGMHKVCLTAGIMACEIGTDLLNLLVEKKVDLILQGHDHTYQRSQQLALSTACPAIQADAVEARCIADDGSDDRYPKGGGPVIVIDGTFGSTKSPVDADDSEAAYFVKLMGWNTPGNGHGFTSFTVSETGIHVRTNFDGTFQDDFWIGAQPPSAPQDPVATSNEDGIVLAWQAPPRDGGSPVTNYTVYRRTQPGTGSLLATLGPVFEYVDRSAVAGTTYFYRVGAVNAIGEGDRSAEVTATLPPDTGPPIRPIGFPPEVLYGLLVTATAVAVAGAAWRLRKRGRPPNGRPRGPPAS